MLSLKENFENINFKSPLLLCLVGLFVVWLLVFHQAILSAAHIWYTSEIFQHGFFVIPGAFYFIWREREKLKAQVLKPNYWVLILLVPFFFLAGLGYAGGIEVFTHIAAFSILPLLIWFLLGTGVAKIIWFPLCFMLFSIPIGEELVPHLQQVTADMAIALLNLTSIPSYNAGLYIEIPEGKFVVAEACSGIRFFIGSIVFGAVYSHISYQALSRKCFFMLLAVIIPIIANALRVFSIVLIGHYVDMEYASGADHLIYGWVFFAIVLFLLILLGEAFREKSTTTPVELNAQEEVKATGDVEVSSSSWSLNKAAFAVSIGLLFFFGSWQISIRANDAAKQSFLDREQLQAISVERSISGTWEPLLQGYTDFFHGSVRKGNSEKTDLVVAWYPENRDGRELISSSNALYDKNAWSLVGKAGYSIRVDEREYPVSMMEIVSSRGEKRWLLYWYQLEDKVLSSAIRTKLYQAMDVMFSGAGAGAMIIMSSTFDNANKQEAKVRLLEMAQEHAQNVRIAVPF